MRSQTKCETCYLTVPRRTDNLCYKVEKILAELYSCSSIWWKEEVESDIADRISKQNAEGVACLLLTAFSKIQEKKNESKMELLRKRNQSLKIWKNLSLSTLQKLRKHVWKQARSVWPSKHLIRRWVCDLISHPSRKAASLKGRGKKWGKMKASC